MTDGMQTDGGRRDVAGRSIHRSSSGEASWEDGASERGEENSPEKLKK